MALRLPRGSIAAVLTDKRTLHLSDVHGASAGTIYLVGAVLGHCSSPALPTSMGVNRSL